MPKYYVISGQIKGIIVAENHRKAALSVLSKFDPGEDGYEKTTRVNEHGFEKATCEDKFFDTRELLRALDIKWS